MKSLLWGEVRARALSFRSVPACLLCKPGPNLQMYLSSAETGIGELSPGKMWKSSWEIICCYGDGGMMVENVGR